METSYTKQQVLEGRGGKSRWDVGKWREVKERGGGCEKGQ